MLAVLASAAAWAPQLRAPSNAQPRHAPHRHAPPRAEIADDTDYYELRFGGTARMLGNAGQSNLRAASVCVIGLGGVGSWAVEALARSGVGALTLMDLDEVCISNTNRQLHSLSDTVGRSKAAVLAERVARINPECAVRVREEWLTVDGALDLVRDEQERAAGPFAVLDAIDGVYEKAALVAACATRRAHLVTCGAAGGKSEPALVRAADLAYTHNDMLLAAMRRQLRRHYGFPAARGGDHAGANDVWGIGAIYSTEKAQPPAADVYGNVRRDCDGGFGTAAFATGAFGLAAAAAVTRLVAGGAPPTYDDLGDFQAERSDERKQRAPPPAMHAGAAAAADATAAPPIDAPVFDSHCHVVGDGAQAAAPRCVVTTCEEEWARVGPGGDDGAYALGVHPWWVGGASDGWAARLEASLIAAPAALVGEIGLDRARLDDCPWDAQLDAFSTQLSLAASLRRPAIIHCVRAHGALLDALLAAPALPPALVLHAYAGSRESAERLLREVPPTTKVYFGFSPPALRGKRAAAAAAAVPADRLLVESDCHDADEAPALVREACATLAELRGWTADEAARRTHANAREVCDQSGWSVRS